MASRAIDLGKFGAWVHDMGIGFFGVVLNVGVASHAGQFGVHTLAKLIRNHSHQGTRFAVFTRDFQLAFFSIMTTQTTGIVKRNWRDRRRYCRECGQAGASPN
jgi:hypothetical protein